MAPGLAARISHIEPSHNTTPSSSHETGASFPDFDFAYEKPLYTEINIPLPRLPCPLSEAAQTSATASTSASAPPAQSRNRNRARSLSSFSPFRSRSSSTSRKSDESCRPHSSEEWPRIQPSILKNREVAAAMDLTHQSKRNRSSTIDALAVVPAVLVLSAELFTPGSGESGNRKRGDGRKDSGVGRWEDGIR